MVWLIIFKDTLFEYPFLEGYYMKTFLIYFIGIILTYFVLMILSYTVLLLREKRNEIFIRNKNKINTYI